MDDIERDVLLDGLKYDVKLIKDMMYERENEKHIKLRIKHS